MVMFFVPPGSSVISSNAAITYVTFGQANAPNSTYTYTAISIGAAATDRVVVIPVVGRGIAADPTNVTINGITMTKISSTNNGSEINLSLWRSSVGNVPTGTTADVVVTWATSQSMCHVNIFRLVGQASATPVWTNTVVNGGAATLLTLGPGLDLATGATMAASAAPAAAVTYTWAGVTESYDSDTESTDCRVSGGVAANIPSTLTATTSGSVTKLMGIAAGWL